MRIGQSSHQGLRVLTLVGRLDLAAVPQVQRASGKQLAEEPEGIICDLRRLGLDLHLARARPPDLRERLALGPAPTTAGAGRLFTSCVAARGFRSVCQDGVGARSPGAGSRCRRRGDAGRRQLPTRVLGDSRADAMDRVAHDHL